MFFVGNIRVPKEVVAHDGEQEHEQHEKCQDVDNPLADRVNKRNHKDLCFR